MTIVQKVISTALLVLALLGLAVGLYQTSKRLGEVSAQADALRVTVAGLEAKTRAIQTNVLTVRANTQALDKRLQNALKADPAWSATPVPSPVVDGLCLSLHCSK